MSRVDHQLLLENAKKVTNNVSSVWNDFKTFVNKGSIVDVAVGLIMASAFGAVANSFVDDILSPVIGLIAAKNLNNAYLPIKCPEALNISCSDVFLITRTYPTLELAHAVGIVTWNYGNFIQNLINFMIKSAFLYLIIKGIAISHRLRNKEQAKTQKDCLYCLQKIHIKACKCSFCGSVVDKIMLSEIHID
jgi:large conductance mechanosensitive channel